MQESFEALGVVRPETRELRDFAALAKPRVVLMVLATTLAGFYLGAGPETAYVALLPALLGTALAAGGTLALNQYMERDRDARMKRTRDRPLPAGRLPASDALVFGAALVLAGLLLMLVAVSALSTLVTATIVVTYLFLYTPMKPRTPLSTVVGALPGALPPVIGWVAASGRIDPGALVLFAILFLWQLPHSLAIAKLYRDDYARAGFRLLPVVDGEGAATERQVVYNSLALLAVGLLPGVMGVAGTLYLICASALGAVLLWYGIQMLRASTLAAARRVLLASLVYLPLLLAVMAIDKIA